MDSLARYFRKMSRVLQRRGCRREEIEDLMQDAFVRLLEYCERGAEVANTSNGILIALTLHEGESGHNLLTRLDETVVRAGVDGHIINELHL